MTVFNQFEVVQELIVSLRNANVLTIAERNVVTATSTGTLNSGTVINIPVSNVKNIRSLTLGSTAQLFGSEYLVNYNNSGTCTLTLASTVTASYSVVYDYGTDKIFPEYPKDDMTLNSFPRIAVEYIDVSSEPGGFGNVNRNRHDISITYYGFTKEDVRSKIFNIRTWLVNNQNNLYYLKLIKPTIIGPCVPAGEFTKFKDKIFKQNQDLMSILNFEVNP